MPLDDDTPISSGTTVPSGPIIACRNWGAEERRDQWIAKCGSVEIPAANEAHAATIAAAIEVADIKYGGIIRSGLRSRMKVWIVQSLLELSIRIHGMFKRE